MKIFVFGSLCKWFLDVEGKEGLGTTHWWDVHFGAVIAGGRGDKSLACNASTSKCNPECTAWCTANLSRDRQCRVEMATNVPLCTSQTYLSGSARSSHPSTDVSLSTCDQPLRF